MDVDMKMQKSVDKEPREEGSEMETGQRVKWWMGSRSWKLVDEKGLADEEWKRWHNLELDNKKTGTHCDMEADKHRW